MASKQFYDQIAQAVRQAGVFADVTIQDDMLVCRVRSSQAQAFYFVQAAAAQNKIWVGLYTPDRWVSESIEADLLHTGDKMEELLEDELVEQGLNLRLPIEHFRDERKRYIFRSALIPAAAEIPDGAVVAQRAGQALLAYAATFGRLGDLAAGT